MSVFRRLFLSRQQRQDAEKARQIMEAAFIKSREPRSCAEAAASGADIRRGLFSVVDRLEAEMGQLVIAYAQGEGVLMTHPRLTQELQKLPDGELLDRSIFLCFITPAATERLNADWPGQVASYQSRPNTDALIIEKATVLTAHIVHNLGVAAEVSKEIFAAEVSKGILREREQINPDQEIVIKLEEACLWYRLIDELTHGHIPEQRGLFMDFFEDNLGHLLALLGADPKAICTTLAARSEEYGGYREWVAKDTDKMAATLFWNAAKRVGAPIGFERHFHIWNVISGAPEKGPGS